MKKITIVAGARPNFMKIAPIIHEIIKKQNCGFNIEYRLVHTGQHYDKNMSGDFFKQLEIPPPNKNLNCGGGTQAEQTANIMIEFEKELIANPTDLVLVVGDVTSTMACSITAKKCQIKVAHVEAGIRSMDLKMPEEINRIVTDSITDYFFTTSKTASENLKLAGANKKNIYFVGNTMIDSLLKHKDNLKKPDFWDSLQLQFNEYCVITLHRPANVDEQKNLKKIINEIIKNSKNLQLIFPVHPRTAKILDTLEISNKRLNILPPLSYLEFNYLVKNCKVVITDSGGITEEATVFGIPCMTLRDSTERPETITVGTNELIGTDPKKIIPAFKKLFSDKWKKGNIPELWDGKTSKRIVDILIKL